MSESSRSWLKGCLISAGVLALGGGLVLTMVGIRTCAPLFSAGRDRDRLEESFGSPGSFSPAPDGAVPAFRLTAFLQVRRSLAAICGEFEAMLGKMERVEGLDQGDPSGQEIAETTKGMGAVALGIAPLIGEFFEARNRALVEAEMGLGEYTYLFAVAYRAQLERDAMQGELFAEGGVVSPYAGDLLLSILRRQVERLAGADPGLEARARLEAEIRRLEEDPQRLPWADGAPRVLEASLSPFRAELDAAFCRATAGIDMDAGPGRAMKIALY